MRVHQTSFRYQFEFREILILLQTIVRLYTAGEIQAVAMIFGLPLFHHPPC